MSDLNDIVAVGLDLEPKTLIHAYSQGVFPWPSPGLPLLWHCPQTRGILEFQQLHVPKRLHQYLKKAPWTFTFNQNFSKVIETCSERGEEGTWITEELKTAYLKLHQLGHAHSIEVWNQQNLVGGLYGVDIGGYFAGESMFYRENHASKAALLFLISRLKKVGREWMDIQMLTPHMKALGAQNISRDAFLKKLALAKKALNLGSGISPFLKEDTHFNYQGFSSVMTY